MMTANQKKCLRAIVDNGPNQLKVAVITAADHGYSASWLGISINAGTALTKSSAANGNPALFKSHHPGLSVDRQLRLRLADAATMHADLTGSRRVSPADKEMFAPHKLSS